MNLNVVHLVGRAGIDPEIRFFDSGAKRCRLVLAVDRRRKNNDKPDWFELEIWDRTAEIAYDYVRKGSLIGIQGSLKIDRWSDRNTGTPRSKPVIRVERLELLGSKRDNDPSMVSSYGQPANQF
ncbi:MAG: single-stranded DNA-binding protein [Prochloron sp. SP5CPC1]|nr:single-stranded DNA-binding protein [Candidatus Paraprochloron terpiosi SP5CPC1]